MNKKHYQKELSRCFLTVHPYRRNHVPGQRGQLDGQWAWGADIREYRYPDI